MSDPVKHGNDRLAEATAEAFKPRKPRRIKTHCHRGHEMTPENTRISNRGAHMRYDCRACDRARKALAAERAAERVTDEERQEQLAELKHRNILAGHDAWLRARRDRGIPECGTIPEQSDRKDDVA